MLRSVARERFLRLASRDEASWASPRKLVFLVRAAALAILDRRLEVADAFAQALAELRQLARAEDEHRDGEDDEQFRDAEFHSASRRVPAHDCRLRLAQRQKTGCARHH